MPVTPRRATRSSRSTPLFTPSPSTAASAAPNTTFTWTSAPRIVPPVDSSPSRTHYNSFARRVQRGRRVVEVIINSPSRSVSASASGSHTPAAGEEEEDDGGTPLALKKGRVDESRFSIGDGVVVAVEGGSDGIGMLTALWEEAVPEESDEEEDDEDEGEKPDKETTRMMAQIHWFFRRRDLPSVMRNLGLEVNEVLLAASATRPQTTDLPVALLLKTVPIYSRAFYDDQFPQEENDRKWKGWQYAPPEDVYWCERAYDTGARGGRVWRVDVDEWKTKGRAGEGWNIPVVEESSDDSDDGSVASEGDSSEDEDVSDDSEDEEDRPKKPGPKPKKRKAVGRGAGPRKRGRGGKRGASTRVVKTVRKQHDKISTSRLPAAVPSVEDLPADPYERALRLLHVGATPESLPCRENEFIKVLGKVEEGVESGGGGCLYIAGVPGTGKTATVHAVVKELMRKAEDGELAPFSYVEINGLKIPSPQHAYTVLWEAISGQKGTSSKTALRGLEAHFGRKTGAGGISGVRGPRGHTFVVLMDELDQLLTAKQDVVYNFFNWPTMRDSQLFVIAIANRMDLPQQLAAKIQSRLGLQTMLFQPYTRASLIEIVQSRLVAHPHSQLDHKVLAPDAIALAATKMAGTNGDARRVLDACRRAVEVAMASADKAPPSPGGTPATRKAVTARDMVQVLNAMSSSPTALFLKTCSAQQKMLLAALVRCVRREGVPEIPWRAVRADHDALTRVLLESNELLSDAELGLVRSSLLASHALTTAPELWKSAEERRIALGMEIGEVGRVLMDEGDAWRRALAGV